MAKYVARLIHFRGMSLALLLWAGMFSMCYGLSNPEKGLTRSAVSARDLSSYIRRRSSGSHSRSGGFATDVQELWKREPDNTDSSEQSDKVLKHFSFKQQRPQMNRQITPKLFFGQRKQQGDKAIPMDIDRPTKQPEQQQRQQQPKGTGPEQGTSRSQQKPQDRIFRGQYSFAPPQKQDIKITPTGANLPTEQQQQQQQQQPKGPGIQQNPPKGERSTPNRPFQGQMTFSQLPKTQDVASRQHFAIKRRLQGQQSEKSDPVTPPQQVTKKPKTEKASLQKQQEQGRLNANKKIRDQQPNTPADKVQEQIQRFLAAREKLAKQRQNSPADSQSRISKKEEQRQLSGKRQRSQTAQSAPSRKKRKDKSKVHKSPQT